MYKNIDIMATPFNRMINELLSIKNDDNFLFENNE